LHLPSPSLLFPYTTLFRSFPSPRETIFPASSSGKTISFFDQTPLARPIRESKSCFHSAAGLRFTAARSCLTSSRPPQDSHRYTRSEEHTSELQSRFDLVCR